MKFQGKTAVVTGGSRDIGRAVSVKLAREGANVVVNYFNNEADADATLAEIEAAGGGRAIKLPEGWSVAKRWRRWTRSSLTG